MGLLQLQIHKICILLIDAKNNGSIRYLLIMVILRYFLIFEVVDGNPANSRHLQVLAVPKLNEL